MIDRIVGFLEAAIERKVFPGCAAGIVAGGKKWCGAVGRLTYSGESRAVREDTVYDVASITKSIPAASLALLCIERGMLGLDDPLTSAVPGYSGRYREEITVRHLLTHTLDFGFRLSGLRECTGNEIMGKILTAPLRSGPGSVFSYANATSILLGLAVERAAGLPLDEAADRYLFKPLGMNATTFHPEKFDIENVAPTEMDQWRGGMVRAVVHDESAYALRPAPVGSAGLFSTVPDLLIFAKMLLDGGSLAGETLFRPETVEMMHTNFCPAPGARAGLGWELGQPSFMGPRCHPSTFGKTGFTGCSFVVDPVERVAVVLLSNHTFPLRRSDRTLINRVRSGLAGAVFSPKFVL